ncbi:amino acid racemase [Paracoccus sp. TK19116]|uniref:Amino acid racemase n=1 Tax=Paracoccus albicereus TaxID=2922394 RepID=A0ABT1MMR8_9RHOB|nr:amino acid racemase [Paracoccus albicereus]MCQ0969583.1 amino acid racemase [Paracoccus albicereus]
MRRVGILGGMGPEATILIMQKVMAGVVAQDDADHIPLIVDQNPQIPSRIAHLIEGTGDDPGPVLADAAGRLVAAGAEALAIPCNTAHHYADAIRASVKVPLLDMIEMSVSHAANLNGAGGRIGILGSPAIRKVGLFDDALTRHGLTGLYVEDEAASLAAIRQIKAQGPQPEAQASLMRASAALLTRGANVQMIACTEFSLIAKAVSPDVTAFDTLDRLAEAIVSFSTGTPSQSVHRP